jgi:hypothetical protein
VFVIKSAMETSVDPRVYREMTASTCGTGIPTITIIGALNSADQRELA